MRTKARRIGIGIVLCAALTASGTAWAEGPFGIEMGAAPDAKNCTATKPNQFKCSDVPKPHPNFESYLLLHTEKTGICSVTAVGKDMFDVGAAWSIRTSTDELAGFLTKAYGPGLHRDEIDKDSSLKKPEEWMAAFAKKQRTYLYQWPEKTGTKLKNNVRTITLRLQPLSENYAYMMLRYDFENLSDCQRAIREKAAENL